MKTFVVIGLGRFGSAVAMELCKLGCEVLAIDGNDDPVQAIADQVTHAVCGDARDPVVLKALGVRNYDAAIVATGADIGTSALITLNLKELDLKEVICKAQSHTHRKVLEKIGADKVIFPEHESGVKLAQGLSSKSIVNFIELSEDYGIVELQPPKNWMYKTIREAQVRNMHHVNVIAVRKPQTHEMNLAPGADYVMTPGDVLVTLGRSQDVDRLRDL